MRFSEYLQEEWRPALGCTEPASIAAAAAIASAVAGGRPRAVAVVCDPRLYKNCYAVGIPNSGRRSGVLWAAAIGAAVADAEAGLEVFRGLDGATLDVAGRLVEAGAVQAAVDQGRAALFARCEVEGPRGTARVLVEGDHSNVVRVELDGRELPLPGGRPGGREPSRVRAELVELGLAGLWAWSADLSAEDRAALRRGVAMNLAIAEHGAALLAPAADSSPGTGGRAAELVGGGVYARMSGEDFTVMTLAGSGNKGITCAVPLAVRAAELGLPAERLDEALALGCAVTSATTHHLGTLSAICGSANAAGIGLAAGLCRLEGGDAAQVSLAVTNMVGNLSGMLCDGAKIGCAMKCTTGVDAAFRAARFARQGFGVPATDGIVGADGDASLRNLARIASRGMQAVEAEVLAIMQEKLDGRAPLR
jgi:L-cysteine desulfidase